MKILMIGNNLSVQSGVQRYIKICYCISTRSVTKWTFSWHLAPKAR